MAGKIHSGGTVHFRLRGDRRVVRRDGAKTLTVDRRPCAARLQRSLFPADRLARAPGRRTPLAVRPLPPGRARPGRLYRSVGALPLQVEHHHLRWRYPGGDVRSRDHGRYLLGHPADRGQVSAPDQGRIRAKPYAQARLCQHLAAPLKDAVEGDEGGVRGVITPWVTLRVTGTGGPLPKAIPEGAPHLPTPTPR